MAAARPDGFVQPGLGNAQVDVAAAPSWPAALCRAARCVEIGPGTYERVRGALGAAIVFSGFGERALPGSVDARAERLWYAVET